MDTQPEITLRDHLPDEINQLCERVSKVSEGMPVLVYLPDAQHKLLHPLVIVDEKNQQHAVSVQEYLNGESLTPPSKALRRQNDLTLEAIHAAADYLPTMVFLIAGKNLHPVTLVAASIPATLKPCYVALQRAQKAGTLGMQPLVVEGSIDTPETA